MEITFNPKKNFQAYHGESREQWHGFATHPATQQALSYALSQMAAMGVSQERMVGATLFTYILLNMSEPEPPSLSERYPAVSLEEAPAKTTDQEQTTET